MGAVEDAGPASFGYGLRPGGVPPLPATPALTVSKRATSPRVAVGEKLTSTLSVSDTAGVGAVGLVMSDTVPQGATVVRTSDSPAVSGRTVVFSEGDVPVGSGRTETITVTYFRTGTVTNTAEAAAANGGSASGSVTTTVTAGPAPPPGPGFGFTGP